MAYEAEGRKIAADVKAQCGRLLADRYISTTRLANILKNNHL